MPFLEGQHEGFNEFDGGIPRDNRAGHRGGQGGGYDAVELQTPKLFRFLDAGYTGHAQP
ncbi:hypothetical protein [Arthrobacter sp. SAFR-014]|uniref:hypothetical protein n=1 Tax=unclassified Arthrobacter TaxID=235627 RepID=UPI003F7C9287